MATTLGGETVPLGLVELQEGLTTPQALRALLGELRTLNKHMADIAEALEELNDTMVGKE